MNAASASVMSSGRCCGKKGGADSGPAGCLRCVAKMSSKAGRSGIERMPRNLWAGLSRRPAFRRK